MWFNQPIHFRLLSGYRAVYYYKGKDLHKAFVPQGKLLWALTNHMERTQSFQPVHCHLSVLSTMSLPSPPLNSGWKRWLFMFFSYGTGLFILVGHGPMPKWLQLPVHPALQSQYALGGLQYTIMHNDQLLIISPVVCWGYTSQLICPLLFCICY